MNDREEAIRDFKPPYVWPNPAFPFRLYLDHPKCRIFIIENLTHNWEWMSKYRDGIRETDFFFVLVGSFFDDYNIKKGKEMIEILNLNLENFFVMCNEEREVSLFEAAGFHCELINQNAWLDENLMRFLDLPKVYDAVYVSRLIALKRHELTVGVKNLALVAGHDNWSQKVDPPPHAYMNEKPLDRAGVCEVVNSSRVGLILSPREGACFASSEYLLCGVPVVSTESMGGRHVWYNDYNAQIVDASVEAVAAGVEYFLSNPRDPEKIRQMHIDQAEAYRARFIAILQERFDRFGVIDLDAKSYFREQFYEKMRKSIKPDFDLLFT